MPFDLMGYLRQRPDRITRDTVADALGVSVATVMRRIRSGFTAEEVIETATALGLSPTRVLIDLGALSEADVARVAGHAALLAAADEDVAAEVLRRIKDGGVHPVLDEPLSEAGGSATIHDLRPRASELEAPETESLSSFDPDEDDDDLPAVANDEDADLLEQEGIAFLDSP